MFIFYLGGLAGCRHLGKSYYSRSEFWDLQRSSSCSERLLTTIFFLVGAFVLTLMVGCIFYWDAMHHSLFFDPDIRRLFLIFVPFFTLCFWGLKFWQSYSAWKKIKNQLENHL